MLVVGSGMLATAFHESYDKFNAVICAAGVSNSLETDSKEFKREFDLINSLAKNNDSNTPFVYFSTASMFQTKNTLYIEHKIYIEKLLKSLFKNLIIIRLPNVIGKTNNNTLINYFYKKIINDEVIHLQMRAKREFIDVSDVVRLTNLLLSNPILGVTEINFSNGVRINMNYLISCLTDILNRQAKIIYVDGGENYVIPNVDFITKFPNDRVFQPNYFVNTLSKYYAK